jgi:plastocyanin
MSATLVLTVALAGGHGCQTHHSGWYSPGYATHYAPAHTGYTTWHAPGHNTWYHGGYTYSQPMMQGWSSPSQGAMSRTYGFRGGAQGYQEPEFRQGGETPPPPEVGRQGQGGYGARDQTMPPADRGQPRAARSERPAAIIEMTNEARFQPESVTIRVGETIEWRNTSDHAHTVTADPRKSGDHATLPEGARAFDSGEIRPGERFTHRFDVPGQYEYVCLPHEDRGMVGHIEVVEREARSGRAAEEGAPANGGAAPQSRGAARSGY